jgi:hypothetical protein
VGRDRGGALFPRAISRFLRQTQGLRRTTRRDADLARADRPVRRMVTAVSSTAKIAEQ